MTVTVLDRALVAGDAGRVTGERRERPDPEVPEKARRRTFTAQYKLDVVAEYDAAATGEKGTVLRREGLYSSHVTEWRRARDAEEVGTEPAGFRVVSDELDPADVGVSDAAVCRVDDEEPPGHPLVDVTGLDPERWRPVGQDRLTFGHPLADQ